MGYPDLMAEKRDAAITAAQALVDRSTKERRDLSPDEAAQADRLMAEAEDYARQHDRAVRAEQLAAQAAQVRGYEHGHKETATMEPFIDSGDARDFDLGRMLREANEHGGAAFEISREQYLEIQKRALASSAATVPVDFLTSLVKYEREAAPMYAAATVLNRPYARDVIIPRLTADPTAASTATAEGAGITEDDAVLSSVTASVFKLALMQVVSNELLRDSGITELQGQLAMSAGRALGYKANNWYTLGTGTVMPWGLAARATLGGTAQGTAFDSAVSGSQFYSWGDIVDLQGYVPAALLPRAAYMTSPAGLRAAMKWRTNTGEPIFEPALPGRNGSGGPAGTLWGYDVWVNSDVPAPGSAVKGWYFGDLGSFVIVDVGGLRIETSRDFKFGNDQYSIRIIREVASDLPDVTAISYQVAADT